MTPQEAITELLSRPDEPVLAGRRTHVLTQPGSPHADVVKRDLCMAHCAWRMHDHGPDISRVVTVRRMKIMRRA